MMLAPDRLSCFWPGLAQAWWRGSVAGLAAALLFGWALCILLLATFVWPNWFWPWLVTLCWLGMFCFWSFESVRSHWQLSKLHRDAGPVANDDRFVRAQREYLRGNWFEAESLLQALLVDTPRDPEAHLLLASVLRRSGRLSAAVRRLDHLVLLDTALRWSFEIRRERQQIAARQLELQASDASNNNDTPKHQRSADQEPTSEQEPTNDTGSIATADTPSVASAPDTSPDDEAADLPESASPPNNASGKFLAA